MTNEKRLLKSLRACVCALEDHVYNEAKRQGVPVETVCPCHNREIKEAKLLIAELEK